MWKLLIMLANLLSNSLDVIASVRLESYSLSIQGVLNQEVSSIECFKIIKVLLVSPDQELP